MSASPWYGATRDTAGIAPDVARQALEWLVALQDEDAGAQTLRAWSNWRAAHPDHERAWRRIELVQGHLQPLTAPVHAAAARAALAPREPHRRRAIKTMAVAALAGGGLAWQLRDHAPWRAMTADHATDVGERRAVALPDGSTLLLNTGSAIDVLFSPGERRVRLIGGEILVTTARPSAADGRPFLIETAQGTATALGTEYSVMQEAGHTAVSVFHGAVRIQPRRHPGQASILHAGHRTRYSAQSVDEPGMAEEDSIAWREGYLVARSMRLDALMAELGRYSATSLSCDPLVAQMRVSGSYPLDDIRKVLSVVAATLQLRVATRSGFWGKTSFHLEPSRRHGVPS